MNDIKLDQCVLSSNLSRLQRALYERTPETSDHCNRLQELGLKFGRKIKLCDLELDKLFLLSYLHDVGKITIPKCILEKPGKLTGDEWEIMQGHSEIGYRITKFYPELRVISDLVRFHHERWDGKGYPLGLKNKEIPYLARIISVIDAYDAMIDNRPYKRSLGKAEAIEELRRNSGTQFDPYVVKSFIKLLK